MVDAGRNNGILSTASFGEELTCGFIREPEVWAQIIAVADVLTEKGYINGRHPILRAIKRRRKLPEVVAPVVREAAA